MISHPNFTPSFRVLAHDDEAQIPSGVVRIEFRNEQAVFGPIAPRGPHAAEPSVQASYRIAQQNCLRWHNLGPNGGQKAGHPWMVLSAWAAASPESFAAYVRNPQSKNRTPKCRAIRNMTTPFFMPWADYFRTFSSRK